MGSLKAPGPWGDAEAKLRRSLAAWRTKSRSQFWATFGVPIAMVVAAILFGVSNQRFFTTDNILLILQQSSVDAIAAIGLTMLLISGGIDISQGAVMALAAAGAAAAITNFGWPEPLALAFGIVLGVVVGLVNGLFAEKAKVPAFIVTLAALFIVRGVVLIYLEGQAIVLPTGGATILRTLGTGRWAGIPIAVLFTLTLYAIFGLIMARTVFGLRTYAIGSSAESASRAGIRTSRQRIAMYALAGGFSAIAGLLLLGRLAASPSELGQGREFFVITAAVVGGASVYGGRGRLWRSFMGAIFVAMLANGLVIANVPAFYQQITVGVVLLAALLLDRIGAEEGRH